jgi:4-amino-4-deoxy-L-arabinose transferase-like glycosyltransferase
MKRLWIWIGFILLTAGLLRFVNLNSLPIFADESIYVRWSQVMKAESTLRFLPLSDGKQPLYMWTVIPFLKFVSDPLIAGRIVSGLAGIGTVAGVGIAAFILFKDKRIALIALTVSGVLPYLVFFNRMALADSLLAMCLIWVFNFSLLSIIHLRWDLSMLAGFALGFAWLTKSPAIFALVLLPLNILMVPQLNRKKLLLALFYLLTTFFIGFGMYNILRLGPEFHMIALRNQDYVFSFTEILVHPFDPLISHLRDSANFYLYLATPVTLFFVIWGLVSKSNLRQRIILAAWFLAPIIAQSAIAKQFTARYLLFTVPFAVILAALGIGHLGQRTKGHILSLSGLLLVIATSLYLNFLMISSPEKLPLPRIERSGYLEEWTAGQGIKEIADQIKVFAQDGPVLVGSEGYFGTPFDGLQAYLNQQSNVRVVGVGVWIDSVSDKLLSARSDNQVFLVVNSSRLQVDWNTLPLELISQYPKAKSPNGTQESLYFFRVLP